jgi:predicted glycosyl hydrolase (DUF1957 family)
MNASLTEMLMEQSPETINLLKVALDDGKIEFLESGAYHPIFPLIPKKFIRQQLDLNNQINKMAFGKNYNPIGVFPPELAVDQDTLSYLSKLGYQYAITPNNSLTSETDGKIPYIEVDGNPFYLVSRNRSISNSISFRHFGDDIDAAIKTILSEGNGSEIPVVVAMDIETYGEHHENYHEFLFRLLSDHRLETIHFKDINLVDNPNLDYIKASSWSTEDMDIQDSVAFPLWDHPLNSIHNIQHAHFDLLVNTFNEVANGDIHTEFLKAQHSCQFWWANQNGRWSPGMIRKGMDLQRKVLMSLTESESILRVSDQLYNRLNRSLDLH